ncbi:PREDICTED: bidirectional sugar transporter SWEET16-like isoform X2 [Nelumbo nucifera]|uniref:Bidirectional sugar transporter SWEET n=2 Tax=Nelumbo nucifera TaxID=4432 RepID=A0A822YVK4_NELNU|nr:PREDICTED: bidirectional sugar transporter SWEET16-like isoform X2 [Nelumbo nucifera]DAD38114.1 TPA_asm: hypothetical protein HUJ06_008755 [Nelumbo nucifera]
MIDSGFGKGKKGKKIIQHYKRVYLVAKRATPHLKGVSDQQSHSILLLLASSIHMASLSFIVGIIGNIISILVFTSPIGTFRRVVKKKSTESFKGLPYICTLLSTSLWSFYGLLKPGGLLIVTVNGTGAVLQFIYVTLFLIYAPKDTKVKLMKLVALLNVGCLGLVIAVTLLAIHGSLRLTVVGFLCAGLTLGMYASPLVAMVPNAIGFVLGSAQLILYAVYRRKSASQKSTEAKEEEGSAHLVRGNVEMSEYEDSSEFKTKNRSLNKGMSLPKSSVARQHSFTKILKTLSLSPYKLHHSSLADDDEDDVEKGTTHSHH